MLYYSYCYINAGNPNESRGGTADRRLMGAQTLSAGLVERAVPLSAAPGTIKENGRKYVKVSDRGGDL